MDLTGLPKEVIYEIASYNGYKLKNGRLMRKVNIDENVENYFKSRVLKVKDAFSNGLYFKFILTRTDEHWYSLGMFESNGYSYFFLHKEDIYSNKIIAKF